MSNVKYLSYDGLSYFKDKLDNTYAPKSHTHNYLPLSGGNLTGNLSLSDGLYVLTNSIQRRADATYSIIGSYSKPFENIYANNLYERGVALTNKYLKISPYNYYMPTNLFNDNPRININYISDALFAASHRYNVTIIGNNGDDLSNQRYTLFDGSYESFVQFKNNVTYTITISSPDNTPLSDGYMQGNFFLSFYYNWSNIESISGRVYTNSTNYGTHWWTLDAGEIISGSHGNSYLIYVFKTQGTAEDGRTGQMSQISKIEFTIRTGASGNIGLTAIEHQLSRPRINQLPVITNYGPNTLYYELTAPKFIGELQGNAATASSSVISTKTGDGTNILYAEKQNEINFGGTAASDTIYFGYRAKDSKSAPTKFVFGSDAGAELKAKTYKKTDGTEVSYNGHTHSYNDLTNKPTIDTHTAITNSEIDTIFANAGF